MAKVILNQKKRLGLQQASVIIFMGIAAVILLALLSYHSTDPGPFRDNGTHLGACKNLAGCKGAWLADFLLGLLGYLAYALPVVLVVMGLTAFRIGPHMKNPNNPVGGINDIITSVGALFTLLSGAGLAHLLFVPFPEGIGGGMLGQVVARLFTGTFLGFFGSILFLLSLFLGSITVVADISWAQVTEKVGDWMLQAFNKLQGIEMPEVPTGSVSGGIFGRFSDAMGRSKGYLQGSAGALDKASNWMNRTVGGVGDVFGGKRGEPEFEGVDVTELRASRPPESPLGTPDFEALLRGKQVAPEPEPAVAEQSDTHPKAAEVDNVQRKVEPLPADLQVPPMRKGKTKGISSLPPMSLLNLPPRERVTQSKERLDELADKLVEALGHYGVRDVKVVARDPGPVITRFELELPDGTKASKISGLASDLARNMCVSSVRVVEVIPGRPTIGVEVPNDNRDVVFMSEMLASQVYKKNHSPLTLALGKDIAGQPIVADLGRMPHLLVAGTTGSGKSVFINAVLMSLLYKATPEDVRMIMIDPKMLELSSYEDIPHLLAPVVTDMKHAANALRWCVAEMERRYLLMSKLKVRNIAGFNEKIREAQERGEVILDPLFDPLTSVDGHPQPLKPLPYIVVIVDEFADMMMVVGKKVEELIARLAQKARASGIHLILATQRPSVDVITGLIKANIPTRIAFQVSTKIDSRTILDQGGADQLLGYGDMLYMPPGTSLPQRVHGALVTDREVEDVANYLKLQGEPDYILDVLADTTSASDAIPGLEPLAEREGESDPLYDEAVAVVIESRRASISYLQRRLKVGYNRAARMIEDMEGAGVVSPVLSNGSRDVLVSSPAKD
ncbi:FtsK/SpoIIIE family DNA translocase [Thiothrix lacustris]|uniref:FtsK/SpoIIIE family DNA translocase n=1 Tax=Thiothrix lacustris TaxID=525917 RepID=UPI0004912E35|nr:DNA translocase FtsK 4TM domain-containing protein [Thiothrix lacustris]